MAHHGETSLAVAPVFYMYGAALFCKAQEETDVFGAGAADASAARDRKAAGEPAPAPACAPGDKGKGPAAAAAADEDDDEDDDEDGSDGEGEGEGEEDVSDMQLAWENLEHARFIYCGGVGREGSSEPCAAEHTEALAQVYVKLGQISMEQEQFDTALELHDHALRLFGTLSPAPHRRLAGILYDSAYSLQQLQRTGDALQRLSAAIAACQSRLTELRMGAASAGEAAANAEVGDIAATIERMRGLESELRESAADEARTKEALKVAFASMAGAASGGPAFDAPRMAAAAAPTVNLGVVGRGVTRITPAAAGGAGPATTIVRRVEPAPVAVPPPAEASAAAAPKRTLEDALAEGAAAAGDAKAAKPDGAGECKQQ